MTAQTWTPCRYTSLTMRHQGVQIVCAANGLRFLSLYETQTTITDKKKREKELTWSGSHTKRKSVPLDFSFTFFWTQATAYKFLIFIFVVWPWPVSPKRVKEKRNLLIFFSLFLWPIIMRQQFLG